MTTNDSYIDLKRKADEAEKQALKLESENMDINSGLQWFKCIAMRLDMALRHAEKYNGYPGVDGHESDFDPRNLFEDRDA